MLDTAGKVFIRSRLAEVTHAAKDLLPKQFGFRAGKSTVDAVMEAVDAVYRVGHIAADLDG